VVLPNNPEILLVKEPVPTPFLVESFATVGFGEVLQQIPLAVTGAPPSEVILPPLIAVILVTEVDAFVVNIGNAGPDHIGMPVCDRNNP
jgi:hypothetical protein